MSASSSASLIVSIHDVAPSTAWATRFWVEQLDRRGIPLTFLAVAGPWEGPSLRFDTELVAWLRERQSGRDEVAQHGWTHRATGGGTRWRRAVGAVAARGCAEFWTLDERDARRRLEFGRAGLRAAGLEPVGFTPPGWLASPAAVRALEALGFRYTTSHLAVTDLRSGVRHRVPALAHRPGGALEPLGATVMSGAVARLTRAGKSVRIALHPDDLTNSRLVDVTLAAIDVALEAGATPRTYRDFVELSAAVRPTARAA